MKREWTSLEGKIAATSLRLLAFLSATILAWEHRLDVAVPVALVLVSAAFFLRQKTQTFEQIDERTALRNLNRFGRIERGFGVLFVLVGAWAHRPEGFIVGLILIGYSYFRAWRNAIPLYFD